MSARIAACLLLLPAIAAAQHAGHEGMRISPAGIVMNENRDRLPRGCPQVRAEREVTIRAGRRYAAERPGVIYGMSEHEVQVEPCTRLTVHFVNEDEVRHQWMVHGLPRYLYPGGMFHIEAMGGASQSGTLIVPAEPRNYLVHCDMAQHMEKGMRAQLVVGPGSGDLWAVPGMTDAFVRSSYLPASTPWLLVLAAVAGGALMLLLRRHGR